MPSPPSDFEQAQHERAHKTWALVVDEPATPEVIRALRRVLRVKRSELPGVTAALPGAVRRGARVDLAPLAEALTEAGVRCEVRRSQP
jgi:hypothetical protein